MTDRPNVVEVLADADRGYRTSINEHDELGVIASYRFAAVMDRERVVLSLAGTPTPTELDALGDRAPRIAEAMRLVADALDPPRTQAGDLELEPLSPRPLPANVQRVVDEGL